MEHLQRLVTDPMLYLTLTLTASWLAAVWGIGRILRGHKCHNSSQVEWIPHPYSYWINLRTPPDAPDYYYARAACSNCSWTGRAVINKGTPVPDGMHCCPGCGCETASATRSAA